MVVLKKEVLSKQNIDHVENIGDGNLPQDALRELGIVLNRACQSILCSSDKIDKVLITSLNTGKSSSHLHFHLIPKLKDEKIRTVHDPDIEGGGLFFLARKEIVTDSLSKYLDSICGDMSEQIKEQIKSAVMKKVIANVKLLKKNFKWDT
jgi:diadenosine tetraphosphate (Ap4A) HIT family hydrolase